VTILHGSNTTPLPPDPGREPAGEQGGILANTILHNGSPPQPPPPYPPEDIGHGDVVGGVGGGGDPTETSREAAEEGDHQTISNESPAGEQHGVVPQESNFTFSDIAVATASPTGESAPLSLTSGQGGNNAKNN